MPEMTYAQALSSALVRALEKDPTVTLIGAGFGGLTERAAYQVLRQRFADRIYDPPIAELGYCGIAAGAAMTGLRPIVTIGTGTFSLEAVPQIMNEAGIAYYGSGGRTNVPVVFHMLAGIRGAGAMQHSGAPQPMYWNSPGLQIACPGSPADARGLMLTAALESKNPVIFIDHARLQGTRGNVDESRGAIPFGVAEVKRQGTDVTIVAAGIMVPRALEAAEALAGEGISAEVVDPRTLVPLDKDTILRSVAKTGRAVVADESQLACGVASEIAATIVEEAFSSLKAPVKRVAIPNVPIPYHQAEEDRITPTAERVVEAVHQVMGR